jgi:hypothetical protein
MISYRREIMPPNVTAPTLFVLIVLCLAYCCEPAEPKSPAEDTGPRRSAVEKQFPKDRETPADDDSRVLNVVATGVGSDGEKALQNAFSRAIEQAVGVLVGADMIVENDRLVRDQILTCSRAFLRTHREIGRWQKDGLQYVRIRASVLAHPLGKKLKANNIPMRLSEESACKMFRSSMGDFTPDKFLSVEVVGQPKITKRTDSGAQLEIRFRSDSNLAAWESVRSNLLLLFEQIALKRNRTLYPQGVIRNRGGERLTGRWSESTPLNYKRDESIAVYLFRECSQDYIVHYFDGFLIPACIEPEVRALMRRHRTFNLCIALLDAEDQVVVKRSKPLGHSVGHLAIGYNSGVGYQRWSAFSPILFFGHYGGKTATHTEELSVSLEDLGRVAKCAAYIEKATEE